MDVTDPSLPPPPALCRAVFTVGRTDSRVTVRITAREASRLRSVAAVRAAREAAIRDLPLQLGGVAAAEIPPSSRPASAAVTPRVAPPPVPELATACDVRCEPLFPREESDAFCVRYSPCDTWLAAGCGDGAVRVFDGTTGRCAYALHAADGASNAVKLPITCLRWRPGGSDEAVLAAADAGGIVQQFRASQSNVCMHHVKEERNQVNALDYSEDGEVLASAGKDTKVRVYDAARLEVVHTLSADMIGCPGAATGHSNRVFALKFCPGEPHLLLSSGWDNTILFWDLRVGEAISSIFGPHVCGDGLDAFGHEVLSGSWRPTKQLELWDRRSLGSLGSFAYQSPLGKPDTLTRIYAARFAQNGAAVAAAGSGAVNGTGDVRVFSKVSRSLLGCATLPKGAFSLDVASDGQRLAVTGADRDRARVLLMPKAPTEVEVE